jgi:hypothetical protein
LRKNVQWKFTSWFGGGVLPRKLMHGELKIHSFLFKLLECFLPLSLA